MAWLRRREAVEPLAVSMAGVRLGDRLLAVGLADPVLVAQLARKTGLTGRVCAVDADAARSARSAAQIEREGALVEVAHAPWGTLPYEADSFDIALIQDLLYRLSADERPRCVAEVLRVLRPGGRVVVIEPAARAGFATLLSRKTIDPGYREGGAVEALKAGGFSAVRAIGERDGIVYVEGARR